ncbi:aminotransferase class I/II-fold pyridoxal phosphate-dependent enzyme [Xenorhabdus bovienii]|uniref:aminotransferase class I/II-fold pyridoxal phosphate-dependent enzyme n=1 Tax=Xenorhabdus bovienii TaxID=40576 RepID=UPI0023B294E9|nr:aminotransferase class I/II-fold pyridoxal phosphate-dependent enzyme [Xenorhabdus bovienii]MDE9550393.1 aminotransferase class I/II-fold pyridoxal phosphate-dependent enzyme [Xenorhabdus bovienii]
MNTEKTKNNFINYKKVVSLANENWQEAEMRKISGLSVDVAGQNYLHDQYGRHFYHFCTTSYLGLDYHPTILASAISAIQETGTLRIANSKNRCKLAILDVFEQELSELFEVSCLSTLSCSSASSGILPLLASGVLTDNVSPTMVFDKFSHYSMNHLKPSCADETEVITAPHNDMNYLEDICKKHHKVAYIADGVYSMGGIADIDSIMYLKEKYGIFLYLDDSHSISALGQNGKGYVRTKMKELDDNVIIVASLAKSFGCSGGVVMFGDDAHTKFVHRYGGPSNWSQSLNVAAIGAGLASVKIHSSSELTLLQQKLQNNIRQFDAAIQTEQSGSPTAIRLIRCGESGLANKAAEYLANHGFFTSAVFFPVVPQGKAAIRVTLRADMRSEIITEFCSLISDFLLSHGIDIKPEKISSAPLLAEKI